MRPIDADKLMCDIEHYHVSDGCFQHWVEVQQTIDVMPAVYGKWKDSDLIQGMKTCTNCGVQRNPKFKIGGGAWNYCPNCGAKMKG